MPTYEPLPPDKNPMFLENRVYQGSSGRVYPLPFYNRISETSKPRVWDAVIIENEFIEVMILPGLGGRIHRATDKTNGYDFIYYQPVIKPALVGLGGPWASGGIEFNWPQHHRPSTFMATDVAIEKDADGSITAWFSEHDPMARMKGMHGVRLRPGVSTLELRVRVYNRTDDVQTQLFWANAAVRAHEDYQSFFPPDVTAVADHAKRAMSTYPLCRGSYYGVDYAARARNPAEGQPGRARNDLSWYANIPVPTSYMCVGSLGDFLGGYDHRAQAGIIHVADHHIAPGKKQWTWGNAPFGHAWDRNLTEPDAEGRYAPYLELMAGVFTDNQPDFSFLQPGETKTWSQWWYPIRAVGPCQAANVEAALSLRAESGKARIGAAVTAVHPGAILEVATGGKRLLRKQRDVSPENPWIVELRLPKGVRASDLALRLLSGDQRELLSYRPRVVRGGALPAPATEPPLPADVPSSDELYLIGVHLEQYRHATRLPAPYWKEALRRDPGDSRSHLALGRWHLRRGEWETAETHLRASIARLTARNGNPAEGEAFYQLGVCLRHLDRDGEAYSAFAKATWNQAWRAAGFHAQAEIACARGRWGESLEHVDLALRTDSDHLRARDLKSVVLNRLGRHAEARALALETLKLDPLDWWARRLAGLPLDCDNQVRLDLVIDHLRAGLLSDALEILAQAREEPESGTAPLISYYRAAVARRMGHAAAAKEHLAAARKAAPDYCFPARREDIRILEEASAADRRDGRARYYLGNLLFDRRRHGEAIAQWEAAVRCEPSNAVAWRNLGIAYINVSGSPRKARRAYARARRADPSDARLLYECDQLEKRLGRPPRARLRQLESHRALVDQRDDLSVEISTLYNQTGQPGKALALLSGRRFQPWEGGEGLALAQYIRAHLLLARSRLEAGDVHAAKDHLSAALAPPANLGEAIHPLANQSDVHYWLGEAALACGDRESARSHWSSAARFVGDFQQMKVQAFSEQTYFSALAWRRLGKERSARALLLRLLEHGKRLGTQKAAVDYFATSLPTLLLFADDLTARQRRTGRFLQAQALLGLGRPSQAAKILADVLKTDPNHMAAADLEASLSRQPP
jgi:tetratricopeptide (TPR) repeat protein